MFRLLKKAYERRNYRWILQNISERKTKFIEMKGIVIFVNVDNMYEILKSRDMQVELNDQCFCWSHAICNRNC